MSRTSESEHMPFRSMIDRPLGNFYRARASALHEHAAGYGGGSSGDAFNQLISMCVNSAKVGNVLRPIEAALGSNKDVVMLMPRMQHVRNELRAELSQSFQNSYLSTPAPFVPSTALLMNQRKERSFSLVDGQLRYTRKFGLCVRCFDLADYVLKVDRQLACLLFSSGSAQATVEDSAEHEEPGVGSHGGTCAEPAHEPAADTAPESTGRASLKLHRMQRTFTRGGLLRHCKLETELCCDAEIDLETPLSLEPECEDTADHLKQWVFHLQNHIFYARIRRLCAFDEDTAKRFDLAGQFAKKHIDRPSTTHDDAA